MADAGTADGVAAPATVIAVAGGDPVPVAVARRLADELPTAATVIAADSGLHVANALGLDVDVIVGDLDSVDPDQLRRAEAAGVTIDRHPPAKNATDLELALATALTHRPDRLVVVGGHGGRLDHLLANVLLLASTALDGHDGMQIVAHMGEATVHVVTSTVDLAGTPGELVTLLPVHGPATGVTTSGLLYPLRDEDLAAGSTRGVSNEFAEPHAQVTVRSGTLLVVLPGALGTHFRDVTEH